MKIKKLIYSLFFIIPCFSLMPFISFAQSPNIIWGKRIGGTHDVFNYSVAVDPAGNVYTTGFFQDTVDFDPGAGIFNLVSVGYQNIFICKLDSSGNFVWAKNIGGTGDAGGYAIAVDASGNVYTTGSFRGTVDFDPGIGIYNLTSGGSSDIFISKLDSSGNFVWAKEMRDSIGGAGYDYGLSIALDPERNVYTTGYFFGTIDFDPDSLTTFNLASAGGSDIFISKLDSSGNFAWAKEMGGVDESQAYSIAVDASENVYTTGWFRGTVDFDPGSGIFNRTSSGGYDIFISKLNSSGNFGWTKTIGGANWDGGQAIAVDGSGNVYTTGIFNGAIDFDPGPGTFNLTSTGIEDIYISKSDSSGNFVWAKRIGGTGNDWSSAIALDASNNVYTTGYFNGVDDFNPDTATFIFTPSGIDIYISKLDSLGNFIWAKSVGGISSNYSESIALDGLGNIYISGFFNGYSTTFGSDSLINPDTTGATRNIFVAKLASCSAYFTIYADTIPHNWFALNHASGVAPLIYTWDWGDGNNSPGATPSHTYNAPSNYNICLTITDATGCASTYCDSSTYLYRSNSSNTIITINVLQQTVTGIIQANINTLSINTLPNPFTNEITMKGTNAKGEVVLYDISGREILRQKTINDETKISTEFISHGFYLLKYIEENKSANFKMTKF